jgi:hypothetical protein
VRRRPACAEQLGEDRVARRQQAALVLRVRVALVREQQARADHHRVRAGGQRRLHVRAVGDAAGQPDPEAGPQRGAGPLEQLQRRRGAADVPAGLDALGDHRIGAGVGRRLRLGHRAALVHPRPVGVPARRAPEGHHEVGLPRDRPVRLARERQQQVDRDRPGAALAVRR